ncbi:MAG: DoxX family protein [Saprospiraceae bacterium]
MDNLINNLAKYSKYIFAVPFLIFGLFHFIAADDMADMVPIPGGVIWVYITGVALVLAAVSIFINKYARLAMFLLGILLLLFVVLVHLPNISEEDPINLSMALKDLALMAAAWMLAGNSEDNKF